MLVSALPSFARNSSSYQYWCVGECKRDAKTTPKGGTILMGGGTDVDAAFQQHLTWADGGDFLVLRASGTDAYNDYIRGLGVANSVATLLTHSVDAGSDPFVLSKVDTAEAIFFAGGDQWTYLTEWQGTPLQQHIQAAIARGVPIGGTSAGCDVQGQYIYTAEHDSVQSDEALDDPFNRRVTLQEKPFITQNASILTSAITDTHFITRDRLGRMVVFLARLWQDGRDAIGIGIDEQTAIAIDARGKGTMLRQGEAGGRAFVFMPHAAAATCEKGMPLSFADVAVQKLDAAYGDTFDFVSLKGGDASQLYSISVKNGSLPHDPYRPPLGRRVRPVAWRESSGTSSSRHQGIRGPAVVRPQSERRL